ncbi:hypothetical protein [Peribacillus asahii]|nr:hypothetical protein [Peribacillus asahii]
MIDDEVRLLLMGKHVLSMITSCLVLSTLHFSNKERMMIVLGKMPLHIAL